MSDRGECNCLELSEGVRTQGCCINVFRDYITLLGGTFDFGDVYSNCNVEVPVTCCFNNLLSGSDPPDEPDNFLECILDKFDAFYEGNNADYVTDCRSIIDNGFDIAIIYDDQSAINNFYRTLCTPECGTIVLDAYNACETGGGHEISDAVFGFCGSNEKGDVYYEGKYNSSKQCNFMLH